jgi:hypothetical protein
MAKATRKFSGRVQLGPAPAVQVDTSDPALTGVADLLARGAFKVQRRQDVSNIALAKREGARVANEAQLLTSKGNLAPFNVETGGGTAMATAFENAAFAAYAARAQGHITARITTIAADERNWMNPKRIKDEVTAFVDGSIEGMDPRLIPGIVSYAQKASKGPIIAANGRLVKNKIEGFKKAFEATKKINLLAIQEAAQGLGKGDESLYDASIEAIDAAYTNMTNTNFDNIDALHTRGHAFEIQQDFEQQMYASVVRGYYSGLSLKDKKGAQAKFLNGTMVLPVLTRDKGNDPVWTFKNVNSVLAPEDIAGLKTHMAAAVDYERKLVTQDRSDQDHARDENKRIFDAKIAAWGSFDKEGNFTPWTDKVAQGMADLAAQQGYAEQSIAITERLIAGADRPGYVSNMAMGIRNGAITDTSQLNPAWLSRDTMRQMAADIKARQEWSNLPRYKAVKNQVKQTIANQIGSSVNVIISQFEKGARAQQTDLSRTTAANIMVALDNAMADVVDSGGAQRFGRNDPGKVYQTVKVGGEEVEQFDPRQWFKAVEAKMEEQVEGPSKFVSDLIAEQQRLAEGMKEKDNLDALQAISGKIKRGRQVIKDIYSTMEF